MISIRTNSGAAVNAKTINIINKIVIPIITALLGIFISLAAGYSQKLINGKVCYTDPETQVNLFSLGLAIGLFCSVGISMIYRTLSQTAWGEAATLLITAVAIIVTASIINSDSKKTSNELNSSKIALANILAVSLITIGVGVGIAIPAIIFGSARNPIIAIQIGGVIAGIMGIIVCSWALVTYSKKDIEPNTCPNDPQRTGTEELDGLSSLFKQVDSLTPIKSSVITFLVIAIILTLLLGGGFYFTAKH